MVCIKLRSVTFWVLLVQGVQEGPRGVPAPVAPCPGHRAGARQEGRIRGVGTGVSASPSSVGPGLNQDSFPLLVFYLSEFCSCLGLLMQRDNDSIRKRPSHPYAVIGGNQEDA